jgi:CBS domain-containing protein
VRRTTVFYDFVPLWGDVALAARLRSYVTDGVKTNLKLIRALFEDAAHHKVPLTFFKGFVTEKSGPHKGQLDLKESGLRFVVECARILALLHGVARLGTLDRIEDLERLGVIPADDGRLIRGAYESFVRLLFKAQAKKIRAGVEPDAYVSPNSIPVEERFLLRLALEATERLQTLVHAAIHTPFVPGLQSRAG